MLSVQENDSNPVWFVKNAVGTGQHCTFIADSIGIATASEHRPKLVKSFITAAFFWRLWSALAFPLLSIGAYYTKFRFTDCKMARDIV